MQQSRLLRYSLLIVAATREVLTYNHVAKSSIEAAPSVLARELPVGGLDLHNAVTAQVMGRETSGPVEGEAPVLQIPKPTEMPSLQRRQDSGQIEALSAQLQALSQSATEAISSVSSSASSALSQMSQSSQSARQSAEQAAQSADQANRQLSQTQSSAASAVSAASACASDQISQSLASMSSQISVNLASAQSSASNAVSSARAAASQFAASQIQAFKAQASGIRDNTDSPGEPTQTPQTNTISTTNLAIIVTVSIVGTAALTTASSCLFLRYRRKKSSSGEGGDPTSKGEASEKPIAVRGSLSPRFPRFGRDSKSSVNDFKLPSLSPLVRSKKAQREIRSNIDLDFSGLNDQEGDGGGKRSTDGPDNKRSGASGTEPSPFRLQKNNGVSSATAVRLIRVGSEKDKSDSALSLREAATEPMPPPPVAAVPSQSSQMEPISVPMESTTEYTSRNDIAFTRFPRAQERPSEERRTSVRSTSNSDAETPGWRPPMRLTTASQNRFIFRDSSDLESNEPTPTGVAVIAPPKTITFNLRTGGLSRTASSGQPKNGRGTFATFPRIRNGPTRESMINRGRPKPNQSTARMRGEE